MGGWEGWREGVEGRWVVGATLIQPSPPLPSPPRPQELTVEWQPPNQAAGLRLQVRVSLSPAPAAAPIVADTLGLLLDNLSATGLVAAEQQRAAGEWEAQVRQDGQPALAGAAGRGCSCWHSTSVARAARCATSMEGLAQPSKHAALPPLCLHTPPLQASRSDQLVRQYVQERAAQDKEANARVAALLNRCGGCRPKGLARLQLRWLHPLPCRAARFL